MSITIEKTRLNIWNVGGFAVAITVTAFGWGVTYSTMNAANAEAVKSISSVRDDIKDIQAYLPAITQLQFQTTTVSNQAAENKKSIEEATKRLDRVVESFGGRLETILERLNQVATNVEVLSSRMNDRQPSNSQARQAER